MGETLWISQNALKGSLKELGYISRCRPIAARRDGYATFYKMPSRNYGRIDFDILDILGVKEGECKQFRFQEVTQ